MSLDRNENSFRSIFFVLCFTVAIVTVGLLPRSIKNDGHSAHGSFCCAVNCMDGRVQDAVKNYMKDNYHVDYVDMVTEPGPNKILADSTDALLTENIKKRVEISVHHHGSKVVAIVGHFGCAGNPAEKNVQEEHLIKAKQKVESFGLGAKVILLWVEKDFKTIAVIE